MKKQLFLLAIISCISFVSCSNSSEEILQKELNELFDFSGVDYENLNIVTIYDGDRNGVNHRQFLFPGTTIIKGLLYDCMWIGIFENTTGRRLFEYADSERPFSGSECGEVSGVYFDEDVCALIMQYPNEAPSSYRLDLIVLKEGHILRSVIDENALCAPSSDGVFNRLAQWTDGILCSYYVDTLILYDIAKDEFICKITEFDSPYPSDAESLYWAAAHPDINSLLITPSDFLHCYSAAINDGYLYTREYQLSFATGTLKSNKQQRLFDILSVNFDTPTYNTEYKIRTKDQVLAITTRTAYCRTDKKTYRTTKTIDIRVENDELKIEIE